MVLNGKLQYSDTMHLQYMLIMHADSVELSHRNIATLKKKKPLFFPTKSVFLFKVFADDSKED